MAKISVVAELSAFVDIEAKKGESQQDFAERLVREANDLKDDDWQALSETTQQWIIAGIKAIEDKEDLPLPSGIEDLDLSVGEKQEKSVKKAKVVKAKKTVVKDEGAAAKKRGPKAQFSSTAKIKLLVKENPKRDGTASAQRFAQYKTGQTVEEALAAGVSSADLRHDVKAEYIAIG